MLYKIIHLKNRKSNETIKLCLPFFFNKLNVKIAVRIVNINIDVIDNCSKIALKSYIINTTKFYLIKLIVNVL